MTPVDLETYVRQRYNAVGDTFFPAVEIYNFFYMAQMIMATKTFCIQNVYTTTSVASQRQYDFPSSTIAILRVEYDGKKIDPNDFDDDDISTGNNPGTTSTGTPTTYQIWGSDVYLRPIPSTSALEIKIYSFDEPQTVSAITQLDVPGRYHLMLADYALFCMFAQDKNNVMSSKHLAIWEQHVMDVKDIEARRRVADKFNVVKDGDLLGYASEL